MTGVPEGVKTSTELLLSLSHAFQFPWNIEMILDQKFAIESPFN